MSVHPAGGRQHLSLGQKPRSPQCPEGFLRRAPLPSDFHALGEVGVEPRPACKKGEHVHVPVTAAVFPVYQAGLWGHGHLIKQCLHRQPGGAPAVRLQKGFFQNPGCFFLELSHAVRAASGAGSGHAPADQASPPRLAQFLPVDFSSGAFQHVHVKEPSHRGSVLDGRSHRLHRQGLGGDQKNGLVAGFLPDFLKMDNWHSCRRQLLPKKPPTQAVAPGNQRAVFHRPRNIHGKADKRLPKLPQQLPLPGRPPLPGIQHFQ